MYIYLYIYTYIYICMYTYVYIYIIKLLMTAVESDPKAPFSIATTPMCRGEQYFISWIVPLLMHIL